MRAVSTLFLCVYVLAGFTMMCYLILGVRDSRFSRMKAQPQHAHTRNVDESERSANTRNEPASSSARMSSETSKMDTSSVRFHGKFASNQRNEYANHDSSYSSQSIYKTHAKSESSTYSEDTVNFTAAHEDARAPVTNVLLYTYMRSGSTVLGELFNRNPRVFYWFEPLAALFDVLLKGRSSSHWFFNEDYTPRVFTARETHVLQSTMEAIFTCNLTDIPRIVFKHRFMEKGIWDKSVSMRRFKDCYHGKGKEGSGGLPLKAMLSSIRNISSQGRVRADLREHLLRRRSYMTANRRRGGKIYDAKERSPALLEKCIDILQKDCRKASVRVVKTIRMRLPSVLSLTTKLPDLRVVRYSRDPRGTMNSRMRSSKKPNITDYVAAARILCEELRTDQQVLQTGSLPNSITAQFEDIALKPREFAQKLYADLDLDIPNEVSRWIEDNTHARKDNGVMGTKRNDPEFVAFKWHAQLPDKIKDIVVSRCNHSLFIEQSDYQKEMVKQKQARIDKKDVISRSRKRVKSPHQIAREMRFRQQANRRQPTVKHKHQTPQHKWRSSI